MVPLLELKPEDFFFMATRDMTRGAPTGLLLRFALPLMLGSIFQQMYTLVDAAVVGQAIGVHALAAVGAADWINWMIASTMVGFTHGFSILTAQRFGAKDLSGLRRSVTASVRLTIFIALALTAVGLVGIRPLFQLLRTPADIVEDAYRYLLVCVLGVIVVAGYNLFAAILRALGDSRNPLIAMIIASLLNVGLDLLFVLVFHWGVAGAAGATVLGQLASCLYCLWRVCKLPQLRATREEWRRDRQLDRQLLRLGAPMAAQNAIISVGGLSVQYVINGFGSVFLAGYTATNKLYGLLEMAAISYGYSVSTYCGQNIGARRYRRIRKGVNAALKLAVATAAAITALMILFGRGILRLFISQSDPAVAAEALRVGYTFLCCLAGALFILYLLYIYRSSLQGMGDTVIPMVSGFVELLMRIGAAMTLPALIGEFGVYAAEILAWTGAAILLGAAYYYRLRRLPPEPPEQS